MNQLKLEINEEKQINPDLLAYSSPPPDDDGGALIKHLRGSRGPSDNKDESAE